MPAPRFVGGAAAKAEHFKKTGKPLRGGAAAELANRTRERAKAFCDRLTETANVRQSCRELKFSVTFIYDWIEDDPEFAAQVERARRAAVGVLEEAAKIRGVDGIDKPVYQGGELVGYVREYSDALLTTLMKAHDPKRYRENLSVDHAGKIDVNRMTDEQLDERIAGLLAVEGTSLPAGGAVRKARKD